MYRSRILHGVLRVITPGGTRFVETNFFERLYLLWTFRNFPLLPDAVLNRRQQRLLARLLVRRRSVVGSDEIIDRPLIGTVERSEPRSGVFGVELELSSRGCARPVSWGSRQG